MVQYDTMDLFISFYNFYFVCYQLERIIEQVNKCPSGALSYFKNSENKATEQITVESIIEPTKNGPLLVYGNILVKDAEGNITKRNKVTVFCRCGQSQNKPYCDGNHTKTGFEG